MRTFLVMGSASKFRAATKEADYSRTISIGSIQGQGDTEMLKAMIEGAIQAGAEAGKKLVLP